MTAIRSLYQLQQAEVEAAERRRRLQAVLVQLQDDPALSRARLEAEDARARRDQAERRLRDLDLSLRGLCDKLKGTQDRLFAGRVTNPKELSALESEAASLKRRRGELEDETVAAMIQVEELGAEEVRAQDALSEIARFRDETVKTLTDEKAEIEERLQYLAQDRERLRQSLSRADLDLYDDLARRRGGRPITVVSKDGTCQACGVAVPKGVIDRARADAGYVHCGSCERLIFSQ